VTAGVASPITGERLTSLFRPRSVALADASDKVDVLLDAVVTWTPT